MSAAASLLGAEVSRISKQVGHRADVDEQYVEAWHNALSEMIYLPSQKRYGRIASATNSDKIESLQVFSCICFIPKGHSKCLCGDAVVP